MNNETRERLIELAEQRLWDIREYERRQAEALESIAAAVNQVAGWLAAQNTSGMLGMLGSLFGGRKE